MLWPASRTFLLAVLIGVGDCAPCEIPQGTSGFDLQAWADKYVIEYGTTPAVECHASGQVTVVGIWRPDDPIAMGWADLPPGYAERENCNLCDYPDNEYSYCDPAVSDLVMCLGTTLDPDYILEDGYAGQDCESWRHLSLYMEGLETVEDLERVCRANTSEGKKNGWW